MNKFCVFCGNKPEKKNKEHIIPKWLIKLTGDENRIINLGINYNKLFEDLTDTNVAENFKNRMFSFGNFQFPACKACNDEYSIFENESSIVFKKLLNEDYLASDDINQLLDWFDKIRVGLWLGSISLDKVTEDVSPNYFIKQRIAKRDRALYIYKSDKIEHVGINFYGFDTPGFQYAPCVFGLRVNNYTFINYSKEDLLARNLGFPYAELVDFDEHSNAHISTVREGLNKINKPIIKNNFYKPTFAFYQAIFSDDIFDVENFDKYTISLLSKKHPDRSQIFYYDSIEKDILILNENDEILIDGKTISLPFKKFIYIINNNVIEELESILKFKHHKNLANISKAERLEENRMFILKFHQAVKKIVNQLSKKDYN